MRSIWQEAVKDEALIGVTQRVLREKGASIAVRSEKPTTNKELRITQVLEPALSAGLLRVWGDKFPELRAEALAFPAGSHDDLLDALAGAYAKVPLSCGYGGSSRRREEPRSQLFADMIPEGNLFFDMRSP